jgi:hypothetical protein
MEFRIGVFSRKVVRQHGFLENRLAASPTLLNGVKDLYPYFPHFFKEFGKNRCSESYTWLKSDNEVVPTSTTLWSDLDKIIKKILKICRKMVSIYRIGAVTNILYLRASMLMYLHTARLSPALGVFRFNVSTGNATEHWQLPWKSAQGQAAIFLWGKYKYAQAW